MATAEMNSQPELARPQAGKRADTHQSGRLQLLFWALRVGVFLCFVGHGTAGLIGKAGWLPFYRIFGIPDAAAWKLMPLVGLVDYAVGFTVLIRPMKAVVAYSAMWTIATALLRPVAGQGTWQEVLERGGNYGLSLALLVLIGGFRPRDLKQWFGKAAVAAHSPAVLEWTMRICIGALLAGHAGFGLSHLHDKQWIGYAAAAGIRATPGLLQAIAWFEMALAIAVLAVRSNALMVFVLAWKVATEALRPLAGEPLYEFVERAGDYFLPFAALMLYSDAATSMPAAVRASRQGSRRRATALGLLAVLASTACGQNPAATRGRDATSLAEPSAGEWRTWVAGDPASMKVAAPPRPGSARAKAEIEELKQMASRRTPAVRKAVEKYNGPLPSQPWTEKAFELVSLSAKNPPLSSRNYALLHVAIYDAVVTAWHWKYEYNIQPPSGVKRLVEPGPDPTYPSEHAAIAGAASETLAHLYPQMAAPLRDAALEAAESRVQSGANTRSDIEAGLEIGRKVAGAVAAYADKDGSGAQWDGKRPAGIGSGPAYWEPPPGAVSPPTAPMAGKWKPWTMRSGDQFRPSPPPAYGSEKFIKAAEEVVEVRKHLTPVQKRIARFYEGAEGTSLPAGIVVNVAHADVLEAATTEIDAQRMSIPRIARALALLNVAMADAGISAWDAKFTYWNPRPENAIRDLGLDADWKPLLPTPRFPAYPSGSAAYAGAAQQVMTYLFPAKAAEIKKRAEDQAVSRLYAGIHWRYDSISLDMGRKIGDLVVKRAKSDGAEKRDY